MSRPEVTCQLSEKCKDVFDWRRAGRKSGVVCSGSPLNLRTAKGSIKYQYRRRWWIVEFLDVAFGYWAERVAVGHQPQLRNGGACLISMVAEGAEVADGELIAPLWGLY